MTTPFFADEVIEKQKTVVVAGATGYIGNAVVQELVKRGYHTVALVRDSKNLESPENTAKYGKAFAGATVMECDVSNAQEVANIVASQSIPVDTIISCLASPTGTKSDAYKIDYQATKHCLDAGRSNGARHFVLLSAFCVRNPLLQLQQAKLKFEAELQDQTDMTYSIVRPTAFFKSVSGQLEGIQNQGVPYILFGDGAVTQCNPISEEDLGIFMCSCITEKTKENSILNIGGPDQPLTNQMLGEVRYDTVFSPFGSFQQFIYSLY
jgi:divinyl chlorophyllide a 8-vinyl-reductase